MLPRKLLLAGLLGFVLVVAGRAEQSARTAAQIEPQTVFLVTGERMTALYHRALCPWLKMGENHPLAIDEAKKRYYQPHCLCISTTDGVPPCDFSNAKAGITSTSTSADFLSAPTTAGPPSAEAETPTAGSSTSATPSSTGATSTEKTVHVREYTRKDGTKVKAHSRRPPRGGS